MLKRFLAAIMLVSCASNPKNSLSLVLVEGQRVGKLVVSKNMPTTDSATEKDQIKGMTQKKFTVTFNYPGKSINTLKIFSYEKILKTCDEAGYGQYYTPNFSATDALDRLSNKNIEKKKVLLNEHNPKEFSIACQIDELIGDIFIELYDDENQKVSKYHVVMEN